MIDYRKGDMFKIVEEEEEMKEYGMAHCISRDCVMGKGIAVEFKKRFGGVEELKRQMANEKDPVRGTVLTLTRNGREICYLVTKKVYYNKPTYKSLTESLEAMRDHLVAKEVKGIVMPKIGCGLDRLQWEKVSSIIEDVFKPTGINIVVCTL